MVVPFMAMALMPFPSLVNGFDTLQRDMDCPINRSSRCFQNPHDFERLVRVFDKTRFARSVREDDLCSEFIAQLTGHLRSQNRIIGFRKALAGSQLK